MITDIIGGGIGGLTTAIALQQKGRTVRIFEQAKSIRAVGAGIILANNAMQVYEKLGLREIIEANGNPISTVNITNAQLNPMSSVDLTFFEKKYQVQNIAIHRGKLQQILVDHLAQNSLQLGHELVDITKAASGYLLQFTNKNIIQSEQVIGADGIHSKVRKYLFPESHIRDAFQVCWRGLVDFEVPKQYTQELNEAWGKRDRFGFVSIAPKRVYWYALKSFKNSPDEHSTTHLSDYFKAYHPVIRDIIKTTPVHNIHTAEITDLRPIEKWYQTQLCLIGDAAHATTPNMGQGACQAIEDAYILAECMHKFEGDAAFSEYQRLRMTKAQQVVNASWVLGKIAHWSNPVAIAIRNQLMKMTPKSMSRKQSESIFQLQTV